MLIFDFLLSTEQAGLYSRDYILWYYVLLGMMV